MTYFYSYPVIPLKSRLTIFSMIGADAIFAVQLNGTGRAGICMTLPIFDGEELDL